MAIDDTTPQAQRAFRELQVVLFRYTPQRLSQVVLSGKRLRALTATTKRKR